MGRSTESDDQYIVPLLEIGPFGGLDPTTEPFYVSNSNFVSGQNFLPNSGYGGFVTAKGRMPFLAAPLPGQCTGMAVFGRNNLPDVYFFAITVAGAGQIYWAVAGGTAEPLVLPNPLTPNQLSSFACSLQWVFFTNGVDRPLKIELDTLAVTYWGIDAPTSAPVLTNSGTSTMVGTYTYSITFGNTSQESSQGAISDPITVVDEGIQLIGIPVSSDPQVTQRNIYRTGGSLGQWRLVHTIPDNTTTTYIDTTGDADITGQQLTVYRDPPLPFKAITNHMERIWGFGTPADASVVYWSNLNEPWGFNNLTGYLPVGENSYNDAAVGLTSIGGQLVLMKTKTTYGVFGNTDSNFITNKLFDIGCKSQRSICNAYGIAFWLSNQGVYMYTGSAPQNISDGGYQISNIKAILDGLTEHDMSEATSFVYDRMFCISLPTLNATYVYDMRSQNWFPLSWAMDQVSFNLESVDFPVIGTNLQILYQIDNWFAAGGDLGSPTISFITSRISDSGDLTSTKIYRFIEVEAPNVDATMFFQTTANPGLLNYSDIQSVNLAEDGPRHQFSLPMEIEGSQIQLNMRVQSKNVVHVQKFGVYGWVARRFSEND